MILWTVLGWALTLWLVTLYGFVGVSLALFIISSTIVIVVQLIKRSVNISVLASLRGPIIAVLVQCGWYALLRGGAPYSVPRLIAVAVSGVILYGAILWLLERRKIAYLMALRKPAHI